MSLLELLLGRSGTSEELLTYFRATLFPGAVSVLNERTLPFQCSRFTDDDLPTNQRNLTDVRTRMGTLLEYELGKAIAEIVSIDEEVRNTLALTYVVANRFPDLAFRSRNGDVGVRFEVKTIQTEAEEKSANFDTLIKDIRKGTDFVVVLVWEWQQHSSFPFRHPLVKGCFILDAYQLAQMRDAYWLNCPPRRVAPGRQGFDLTFGINCREGRYNKEEGNYGKLMRIFHRDFEKYLPAEVATGSTLQEYYQFAASTHQWSLSLIQYAIAKEYAGPDGDIKELAHPRYTVTHASSGDRSLLLIGVEKALARVEKIALRDAFSFTQAMALNQKFGWAVFDRDLRDIKAGKKPRTAAAWAKGQTS